MTVLSASSQPPDIRSLLARIQPPLEEEMRTRLRSPFPKEDPATRLYEAMEYAALGPGKRLRPALTIATCEALGGTIDTALAAACAVELLHAYTLVHDDLPAMDDDDERRGRATVHIQFDEATAVLAGDALLTSAFDCLSAMGPHCARAVRVLAEQSGAAALLAGQARDISGPGETPSLDDIEIIHRAKTGALFSAAAELGALSAGQNDDTCQRLRAFGMAIGVAFQLADDADDGEFPHLADERVRRRQELAERARELLPDTGSMSVLSSLAHWFGTA